MKLQLELSPLGARVRATVRLINTSDADVIVNGRLLVAPAHTPEAFRELTFEVRGPSGYRNSRLVQVNAGPPRPEDFVTLPPGEAIEREAELTELESLHLPGCYEVRATYTNQTGAERLIRRPWSGTITSEWERVERG